MTPRPVSCHIQLLWGAWWPAWWRGLIADPRSFPGIFAVMIVMLSSIAEGMNPLSTERQNQNLHFHTFSMTYICAIWHASGFIPSYMFSFAKKRLTSMICSSHLGPTGRIGGLEAPGVQTFTGSRCLHVRAGECATATWQEKCSQLAMQFSYVLGSKLLWFPYSGWSSTQ